MSNLYIKFFLTFTFILAVTVLIAQPPAPPATPIDGGLGILLAGGAAYGLKKLKDRRREK